MLETADVRVRHLGSVAILDLAGDVTGRASDALTAAYTEALQLQPAAVLLDFSEVEYINSTGIAVLVGILSRSRKEGKRLAACGLGPHYLEIFTVTRLVDFIEVFDDEESALRGLSTA